VSVSYFVIVWCFHYFWQHVFYRYNKLLVFSIVCFLCFYSVIVAVRYYIWYGLMLICR
jgi:hypothetical protein